MAALQKQDEFFEVRAVRDFKSVITHSDLVEEVMLVARSMRDQPPTAKDDKLEEEKESPLMIIRSASQSYRYHDELNQLKSIGFTDEKAMKSALD